MRTLRRQQPISVLLWMLAALAASLQAAAQQAAQPGKVVRTGADFAAALADARVVSISLDSSLVLQDSDFGAYVLPLELARDVEVRGTSPAAPVLDLNYVKDKLRMRHGVTLSLVRLVVDHYSVTTPSIAPGFDIILPNLPNETSYVRLVDSAITISACYPPPYNAANMGSLQRLEDFPEPPHLQFNYSQAGCTHDTRALATFGPPAQGSPAHNRPALNGSPYPALDICWATRLMLYQLAMAGSRAGNASGVAVPTGYILLLHDTQTLCRILLRPQCVEDKGPIGCLIATVQAASAEGEVPLKQLPGAGGDGGGGDAVLAGVLAGVLGGVACVGAMVGLLLWRRRRQAGARAAKGAVLPPEPPRPQEHAREVVLVLSGADSNPLHKHPEGKEATGGKGDRPSCASVDTQSDRPSGRSGEEDLPVTVLSPCHADLNIALYDEHSAELISSSAALCSAQLLESRCSAEHSLPMCGRGLALGSAAGRQPTDAPGHAASDRLCIGSASGHLAPAPGGAAGPQPGRAPVVQLLPDGQLGAGAFGLVRRATFEGKQVAVKLISQAQHWGGEPDDKVLDSLRREVEVLGRCQHPNVVRLLAACTTPPHMCLVMELMECSLEALLYGSGAELPLAKALHIGQQIAQGLAYLHPTIFHRDLKPANVLLNHPLDPRPEVKISDFGLSKLLSTCVLTTNPEQGTPAYAPPEAYDPSNTRISCKADIYSLGVLLWEMLARRKPWEGCNHIAIGVALVMQKTRLPLDGLDEARCPPRLRELLGACWEEDPQRRPAAAEVVKVLALAQQRARNADMGDLSAASLHRVSPGRAGSSASVVPPSPHPHPQHALHPPASVAGPAELRGRCLLSGDPRVVAATMGESSRDSQQGRRARELLVLQGYVGDVRVAGQSAGEVRVAGQSAEEVRVAGQSAEEVCFAGQGAEEVRADHYANLRSEGSGGGDGPVGGSAGAPATPEAAAQAPPRPDCSS